MSWEPLDLGSSLPTPTEPMNLVVEVSGTSAFTPFRGGAGEEKRSVLLKAGVDREELSLVEEPRKGRDILSLLKDKLGAEVLSVNVKELADRPPYIEVVVQAGARRAMELWLSTLEDLRHLELPIFFTWTGETDLPPEELGALLAKALAKMGLHLATEEPIDAVKVLREEWE